MSRFPPCGSSNSGLLDALAADFANHYVWSLAHPDWEVKFDRDKAAAAATRKRILDMLAADKQLATEIEYDLKKWEEEQKKLEEHRRSQVKTQIFRSSRKGF